jgi:ATP-dependent Lon protease
MNQIQHLPVLSLTDTVVLPGMVVPIELDESSQAAIDAARSTGPESGAGGDAAKSESDAGLGEILLAPRLKDRYATYGVVATIEQVGQLAGGAPAAVLRAGRRAKIAPESPDRAPPCGWQRNWCRTSPPPTRHARWQRNTNRW